MGKKRIPRKIPRFACPFSTKEQVIAESGRYGALDGKNKITDVHCLKAGGGLFQQEDERENLCVVYRWKLQAFRSRFKWVNRFPDDATDKDISHALDRARALCDKSSDSEVRYAAKVLTCLPNVGIPVASAFMMAMHPRTFTVIDRQAYKALKADFREPIHPDEYLAYLKFCRLRADQLDVKLREYDRALWMYGSRQKINKRTKTANRAANRGVRSASVSG
jgi:hypothetical protein